jgi:hypothetical protein
MLYIVFILNYVYLIQYSEIEDNLKTKGMLCSCVNNLYNQSYTSISSKKTTALLEKTIIIIFIITPQNTKGK